MKALSLTQPWASLVAIEAKRFETRGWVTKYRGDLAIASSKRFPREARNLCTWEPAFMDALADGGFKSPDSLPLGCVLAIVTLKDCFSTNFESKYHVSQKENFFGNYDANRWVWVLENVRPLSHPVPCVGQLGLWEWEDFPR